VRQERDEEELNRDRGRGKAGEQAEHDEHRAGRLVEVNHVGEWHRRFESTACHAARRERHDVLIEHLAHAVHQQLTAIERTQVARRRIAEPDDPEKLVVGRIGDGHRVRELLRGVDTIAMADRHVRIGCRPRRLSAPRGLDVEERGCGEQCDDDE